MPKEVLDKINKELAEFEAKKYKLYTALKADLFEVFRPVFDNNPGLDNFSWTQYSPYFNDGDECTFHVRAYPDWGININGQNIEDYEEDNAEVDDAVSDVILTREVADKAAIDVSNAVYSLPEDFLKEMFGNHKRVTVHADGEIVSDYYDHD